MHSEGILAGELKHGPLALIDKHMPVIMIIMRDACYTKCHNALQQVTARQVTPHSMTLSLSLTLSLPLSVSLSQIGRASCRERV